MRLQQLLTGALLMSTTILGSVMLPAHRSAALCVAPSSSLVGDWKNTDAKTRGVTRVKVSFACGDVVLCDQNGNCSQGYTGYVVRVYGACHPTDCDWGQANAKVNKLPGEVLSASYHQSFANRNLVANVNRGQLWLTVNTHFTDRSGRSDYTANYYFNKVR